MPGRRHLAAAVVLCAAVTGLSACSSSSEIPEVSGTTTPFSGPLTAMTEPVTFNASAAAVSACHSPSIGSTCSTFSPLSDRDTDHQVTIDPIANTVRINIVLPAAIDITFSGIRFTSGTTAFDTDGQFLDENTLATLKILLPGPAASGLDWASYGLWSVQGPDPVFGGVRFEGGALSFGVLTPLGEVPTTGSADYTGFMDGFYVNASSQVFSLTGNAAMTADFASGQIGGQFNGISATAITFGASSGTFRPIDFGASISGNNFSGDAVSAGMGQGLSGPVRGTFYGPGAQEAGGVFRLRGGSEHAVGGFAVRQ